MRRTSTYPTESDGAQCGLFVFDHPDMPAPVYLTNAAADLSVNGDVYEAIPMQLLLPPVGLDAPPAGQISVDNTSRRLIAELRSLVGPMTCNVTVVKADDPTVVEYGPLEFEVRNVVASSQAVTADLAYEPLLGTAIPGHSFGPATTPGLYRT